MREPIIGGPCEGCEAVFEGMPVVIRPVARIARIAEVGQPMIITGVVRDHHGAPAGGVIVYAYQTDAKGAYPPPTNASGNSASGSAARRHGGLRGWAMTDSIGQYQFTTIRPGHYPGRDAAAHVHMHVIEPGCCTYYIASILFRDDPLLSDPPPRDAETGRGGDGLTRPTRSADGAWRVRRDIQLGAGIPGYEAARRRP